MNKEYFENLYDRLQDGEVLSKTEINLLRSYDNMKQYEYDWMGIQSASDIGADTLVQIMKESNIEEIYIEGEWSNQFEHWFKMQEAGLEMTGIRQIDNPRYTYEMKRWGSSSNNEKTYVLVFRLK
jgi:hypothetical protein